MRQTFPFNSKAFQQLPASPCDITATLAGCNVARERRCRLRPPTYNCAMPTDVDRTADYKGFTIRTFKAPNGSWRAIITKADGSKIKAAGQNESFDMIPVQLDSLDRDKALKEAKRLIDAAGMT